MEKQKQNDPQERGAPEKSKSVARLLKALSDKGSQMFFEEEDSQVLEVEFTIKIKRIWPKDSLPTS